MSHQMHLVSDSDSSPHAFISAQLNPLRGRKPQRAAEARESQPNPLLGLNLQRVFRAPIPSARCTIESLDDRLLEQIFLLVDDAASQTTARLHVLPVVSKRWKRIMEASACIWERARFKWPDIFGPTQDGPQRDVDQVRMAAWFGERQGRFKELGLSGLQGSVQMPPAVTPMLKSTQAASLKCLSVDVDGSSLRGPELGTIAVVQELTELVVNVSDYGLSDWGSAVIGAASCLTALQRLELVYVQPGGNSINHLDAKLPRCQELAVLRSNSLRMISVGMASGSGDVLRLAGLRNLRVCHLIGYAASTAEFRLQSTSFGECTRLVELTLHYMPGLTMEPGCFRALSAMTELTIDSCGLLAVPLDIAHMTALRRLDLRNNQDLVIDETTTSMLRTLRQLRTLIVASNATKAYDATMKRGVQALFDLQIAFSSEGLHLAVQNDPASAEKTFEQRWAHFGRL